VPPPAARIAVPVGPRTQLIEVGQIELLEAQDHYVALHAGRRSYLLRETLSALEGRLDRSFVRIHRSRIARVDAVEEVEPLLHGAYQLALRGGGRVTSARGYRDRLRAARGLGKGTP
jgi:two-component system, LytTR family, response regulator